MLDKTNLLVTLKLEWAEPLMLVIPAALKEEVDILQPCYRTLADVHMCYSPGLYRIDQPGESCQLTRG